VTENEKEQIVREHYRHLGHLGGTAANEKRKGTPQASEWGRKTVAIRWAKYYRKLREEAAAKNG
jgi:hypothetical protein